MKTVWLTRKQLADAFRWVNKAHINSLVVSIPIETFGPDPFYQSIPPPYKTIHVQFRRAHQKSGSTLNLDDGSTFELSEDLDWELITPVQICDEWIARQMQTTNF